MQINSLQICKHPTVNLICDVTKFHKKPIEGVCNEEQMSSAVHMLLDISQRERVPPKDNEMKMKWNSMVAMFSNIEGKKQKKNSRGRTELVSV